MERAADVLPMDKAHQVKQAWPFRLDAACRRIPGLGIFICFALMENWFTRGRFFVLAAFVVVTATSVLNEFAPPK